MLCCAYPARIRRRCCSPWISRWSRYSLRSIPTYRSAKEFARGARGGALITVTVDREPGRGSPGELEARHSRFLPRRKGRVRLTQVVWC